MILVPFGEDPYGTGTYTFVKELGCLVKISGRANSCVFDCFCPEGGYISDNLGPTPVYVESRSHKRQLLQARGLREASALSSREV